MKTLFSIVFWLLLASAANAQVSQTFTLSWSDNSSNEEGFYVYRNGTKIGGVAANITSFKDTVTGAGGQQFCYQVSAFNHASADGTGALQESTLSNQACGTLPVPPQPSPNPPSGLTLSALSTSSLQLSWGDESDNETGFRIEGKKGTGQPFRLTATVGANVVNYSWTGLNKNTTYCARIAALGVNGYVSPWNGPSCATTLKQ